MKVLVTGVAGFIGMHCAERLIERGDRVRGLVRDPQRGAQALRELPGMEVARGDLRDAPSLNHAVEGCGVVYHVAADYRLWAPDPAEMYRSNVEGTRHRLSVRFKNVFNTTAPNRRYAEYRRCVAYSRWLGPACRLGLLPRDSQGPRLRRRRG